MDYRIALDNMFPGCVLHGSVAELDAYSSPQNCEILAQGRQVRLAQEGRKLEYFLVDFQGTMMFLSVADKWPEQGVAQVSVTLSRMEGVNIPREKLEIWAREQINYYCPPISVLANEVSARRAIR